MWRDKGPCRGVATVKNMAAGSAWAVPKQQEGEELARREHEVSELGAWGLERGSILLGLSSHGEELKCNLKFYGKLWFSFFKRSLCSNFTLN